MANKYERKEIVLENNTRKEGQEPPFDESFDWDTLLSDHDFTLSQHPEMFDNYSAYIYLKELGLRMSELRGKKLLDLGAGAGAFVRVAVREGVDAVALDNNMHPILAEKPTPFVQASAFALPFAENTFDTVVSKSGPLESLHWAPEPDTHKTESFSSRYPAMAEAIRVLKPGGEIRFSLTTNMQPDLFSRNESRDQYLDALRARNDVDLILQCTEKGKVMYSYASDEDAKAENLTEFTSDQYLITVKKK